MITMKTELLEYLVRQCVREVLDQVEEEANASKLKSSNIGKGDGKEPAKQKVTVKPFIKGKKSKVNITKLNEEEVPPDPSAEQGPEAGAQSEPEPVKPEEPTTPEKPEEPTEKPQRIPKGALLLNPKDKSKPEPIKWQGRDDASIERTLHQAAASIVGSRTKVSLGAKRMARELVANPNTTAFFYFGKIDPESEEVFLLADKSLQIAKTNSIPSGELMGTPVVSRPPAKYRSYTGDEGDEPPPPSNPDNKYSGWMTRGKIAPTATPRYGIDEPEPPTETPRYAIDEHELNESATKLIKRMVNQILDK